MYKRIMVAIDGSDTAQRGLKHAIDLARDQKARLAIIQVIDVVIARAARGYRMAYIESEREHARDVTSKALDAARAAGVEAEVQTPEIERDGQHVTDAIVDAARAWQADLLVIGTHGQRGWRHLLLGSVAEGIVRAANTPVLLVRADGK